MKKAKKLFLLDAYALIFRAYYAFIRNPRMNSRGLNTSAMFGFVNVLEEVLRNQKPTHIAVVFDHKSPNVRVQEFPYYKAHRQETPEDIRASEPWIRKIIEAYHIPILETPGYEADDVIGTLAKVAEKEGYEVYMMTPDKDFAQLVSEHIYMYKPGRQGNGAEVLGVDEVREKFQVETPEQVIDILGLMGDSADNIPGIPGVGEKTAIKLIKQFGSVENLLENTDQLKGKQKEKVEANMQQALDSKKLATILLDAPVPFEPEKLVLEEPDKEALSKIFAELEFRTIGKRILGEEFDVTSTATAGQQGDLFAPPAAQPATPGATGKNVDNTKHTYHCVDSPGKIDRLVADLEKQQSFAFDTETTGLDPHLTEIVGMSFSWEPRVAYYVPCPESQDGARNMVQKFAGVFGNEKIEKVGHNIKFDMQVLRLYGVHVRGPIYDTMVAHYVGNSTIRHKMDVMAEAYLGYQPVPIEELIGKKGKHQRTMRDVPLDKITEYAAEDADITWQLRPVVEKMIDEVDGKKLMQEIELPLIYVLTDMECEGIRLDVDFLKAYSAELNTDLIAMRDKVFDIAGVEFNLDSPKQLGEVLFEKMEIPYVGKKTATGQFSTSESTLRGLEGDHEIVDYILDYRELTKLKSTYVDALPALVNPRTGRVHTTFNQTIAATGRLSSLNPNLQNIPIRTERGREIRKAFIPRDDDFVLLAADYSQVELRIIAAITQDEGMLEAFRKGEDIHSSTAAKVFGVALDEVDSDMRRKAKAVNFGLAYGQSAFGLSQTLKISRSEAKEIIDNYFEKFPGIRNYMKETVEFARAHGYVETLMKRRRYLRDINSRNHTVRSQAERNAINTPIQGSAADLIKIAMIRIHDAFRKEKFNSRMLLQVHDELVFDARKDELDRITPIIEELMKTAIPDLQVPIEVDVGTGANWLEAH